MQPKPTASELKIEASVKSLCERFKQTYKSNKHFETFHGNFIYPDFRIEPARLIIEIDGSVHWSKSLDRDCKRDFWLEDRGYAILHIPNKDTGVSPDDLLALIKKVYPTFPKPSVEMFNRHKDFRVHKFKKA